MSENTAPPHTARETRCELGAGDLLYLPCGWFHDVTSFDEHRALNYWFHPPDRTAFARPYAAVAFWEAEWRAAERAQFSAARTAVITATP